MVRRGNQEFQMSKAVMVGVFATVFLKVAFATAEAAQAPVLPEDEIAVRSLVLERIQQFNRHQAPEPGAFTEDADFVNAYGMWRRGPAEIEGRQKERMKSVLKDAKITLLDLRIRFARPDVAIVHQLHEISGMRDAAGKSIPSQQELSVRVMVKEQGKWLTTVFHNTIVRQVDSPASAR
jgi:uncharacterized protein (TIGR02246 family)